MTTRAEALRMQLNRQVAHWQVATVALDDLENFASEGAWQTLERYLGLAVRGHLAESVSALRRDLGRLRSKLRGARTLDQLEEVRANLVAFRVRFLRTETVFDYFGDAVNTRTSPRIAALLRACDKLAHSSMRQLLSQLGQDAPPVLTYVDKGLGAAILRANLRLWDGGSLNPVAAIKVVRHNLLRPAGSLFHESGHQVAHLTDWNESLRDALGAVLADQPELGRMWQSWASEVTADSFAFVHTGYASVATLHDVLAGDFRSVFRLIVGDPHPVSYIRVLLGVEMCRHSYGSGPWDDLADAWVASNPLDRAHSKVASLMTASIQRLPEIARACLTSVHRGFGQRSLVDLVDPARVSPVALEHLASSHGPALVNSPHLLQTEGVRIAALYGYRTAIAARQTSWPADDQEDWLRRLGTRLDARAA